MKDPYSILGVSRSATDDEIKKAYRALCRKYHPDVNRDNPEKAEEKFKEIGEAYRTIIDERQGKKSSGSYQGYSDSSSDISDSRLRAAAIYLQRGYFREALNTLNSIENRNALWFYLSAATNARIGNIIIAREHAKTAVGMEPSNPSYQKLYAALNGEGDFYQDYRTQGGTFYGREINLDTDYCVKCCAANIMLNVCCSWRLCFCC